MNTPLIATVLMFGTLIVGAQPPNLLQNAGFENGLTNWTATGNAAIRTNDPLPHERSNYIFGLSTALFTVSQVVDLQVAGISATLIDSGELLAFYGGFQAGYSTQTDNGTISVRFLDAANSEISSASLAAFYSNHTWRKQAGVASIPTGTRSIVFYFRGTRNQFSNNDAYLDSAFLQVDKTPAISLLTLPSGNLSINFTGMLYQSVDLRVWTKVEPQPASPFMFSPSQPKLFFQARSQ